MSEADICALVNGRDRSATARCVFGFFDGQQLELLEGSLDGSIAKNRREIMAMAGTGYLFRRGIMYHEQH